MEQIKSTAKVQTTLKVFGTSVLFIEYCADNSALNKNVVKVCVSDNELGIAAEYAWIKNKYPDYKLLKQSISVISLDGNIVNSDLLEIITKGVTVKVYFDISQFFETNLCSL
ncbi:MAG: hypothetical protein LBU55_05455 [Elusimicrobiota bacterium]|jgi:hypothetical protein|nr:hypothetical protein [Elusimicrobiota bacterium]